MSIHIVKKDQGRYKMTVDEGKGSELVKLQVVLERCFNKPVSCSFIKHMFAIMGKK
jgi:hypothetical protein